MARRAAAPRRPSPPRIKPGVAPTRPIATPSPVLSPSPALDPRRVLAELLALRERVADDFYRMGELLVVLKRPEVHRTLGFRSFEALLRKTKVVGRVTAYKLIAIVKVFPRNVALARGRARAYALLRLMEAGGDVEDDDDRSVREIDEDTRNRRGPGKPRRKVPARGLERASALQSWLRSHGVLHARVRAVVAGAGEVWQRALLPDAEVDVLLRA